MTLVSAILSAAISALIEKALGHDENSDPREQERKNSGIGFFDVRGPNVHFDLRHVVRDRGATAERPRSDISATTARHLGYRGATRPLHQTTRKTGYMDQCTFGAGPLRGARGETESKRPAKKSEHARIFPFLFARLTLSVKDGREIVPDPTPAEQPRGPRPHGLRHGAKPLKTEQVMSAKDEGESDNVGGLPTEFQFDESPVRAVVQDDEPWFVAKDVCDILGIDNPSQAVGRLDDDEKGITNTYTTAGLRETLTVNEFRRLQPRLHQP